VLSDGTQVVVKYVTPSDWAMVVSGRVSHVDQQVPALMRRGWEMFSDVAPADVTQVIATSGCTR
jgi:hypothetical protein